MSNRAKNLLHFINHPSELIRVLRNRVSIFLGLYVRHDIKVIESARWFKDKGDETISDFPLNSESVVMVIGGYEGDVCKDLSDRFDCHIYVFEPVKEFFKALESRFSGNEKVRCFNFGLANSDRFEEIALDGTGSSLYKKDGDLRSQQAEAGIKKLEHSYERQKIELRKFDKNFLEELDIEFIDLFWMNAEGAEFEILPTIFDEDIANYFNFLLLQFHDLYPDSDNQRNLIRSKLQKTHKENWCYEYIWECWEKDDSKSQQIDNIIDKYKGKKVLFVPDSIWGNASGHRSSKYVVKAFNEVGVKVGVYASKTNYTKEQESEFNEDFSYFEQTEYSYRQNIFPSMIKREFLEIIKSFKPDIVFYMGTLKNKVTMDICSKLGIPYSYLPLTTEYYCVKDFAGLEDGPCFQCMKSPIISPFKNRCLGSRSVTSNFSKYVKEILFNIMSRKRILNSSKIVGYSENQLQYLRQYGAKSSNITRMPIFFDPETISEVESNMGDYFLMAGQNITAKGWHVIPDAIKNTKNTKFKLIMFSHDEAIKFIKENGLSKYLESNVIELVPYLETHQELLEVVANSRGVLVPSYYATTGEFYLLEALGLGKPTILFDAGIHGEIIEHGKNGMISEIGDLDGFHANIQKVNDDDDLYHSLSLGARKLFDELLNFSQFESSLDNYFPQKSTTTKTYLNKLK